MKLLLQKILFPKNTFVALASGIIWAGLFSAVLFAIAADRDEPYQLGETLNPQCSPGQANCTVTTPASYSFNGNNFDGSGNFVTAGTASFASLTLTTAALSVGNGGTGLSTAPTDGQILIGKSNGTYALAGLTAGSGISITPGDGTITISASGSSGSFVPYTGATSDLNLGSNDFITNGNVGVGTNSPQALLHLSASDGGGEGIMFTDTSASAGNKQMRMQFLPTPGGTSPAGIIFQRVNDDNSWGADLVTIRNSGNVGIGTNTPTYKLDVRGTIGTTGAITAPTSTDTINGLIINAGALSNVASIAGSGTLAISSGGTNQNITLTPSGTGNTILNGKVGIGTTSPTNTLDIVGDGVRININNGSFDSILGIGTAGGYGMYFGTTSNNIFAISDAMDAQVYDFTGVSDGTLSIKFGDISGNDNSQTFELDQATDSFKFLNGNVGIGATSPESLLDISKSQNAHTGITVQNLASTSNTGADAEIILKTVDSSGYVASFHSASSLGNLYRDRIVLGANSSSTGVTLMANGTGQDIRFVSPAGESVRINSSGNVGIGTTTPDATLRIAGASPSVGIGPYYQDAAGRFSISGLYGEISILSRSASYWTENPTTGERWSMYNDGGKFKFWSGTDKVTFQSNGNVGIGTTSPGKILDVYMASDNSVRINRVNNTIYSNFNFSTGGTEMWAMGLVPTNDDFVWRASASTDVMKLVNSGAVANTMVLSAGKVGIGTTSPNAKLESLATTEQLRLSYNSGYYSKFTVNSAGGLTFTPSGNSTTAYNFTNAAGTSILDVDTTNSRVGIGTTTPNTALNVVASNVHGLNLGPDPTNTINSTRLFFSTSATNYGIAANTNGLNIFYGSVIGSTSGTSGIVLNSSGNVGIGTTNPAGLLDVSDSSGHTIVNGVGIAPYRFENTTAAAGAAAIFTRGRGTQALPVAVQSGDTLGYFRGRGYYDSSNFRTASEVAFVMDGAPSASSMPGRIEFRTNNTNESSDSPSTRMTIKSNGNVGIGTTSPTAFLNIKAGTATAGTAPLKFTSGVLLSTPEAGAIEYDGTNLYFTNSTPTRQAIALASNTVPYAGATANVDLGTYNLTTTGSITTASMYVGTASSSSSSLKSPGTVASVTQASRTIWNNPSYAMAEDGNSAYALLATSGYLNTQFLKATNFGFAVPTNATITGIKVEIKKRSDYYMDATDLYVYIIKSDGSEGTTNKALSGYWPSTLTYSTYGGTSDLWGETWTPSDINDSDFGVEIMGHSMYEEDVYIDHIRITVYYSIVGSSNQVATYNFGANNFSGTGNFTTTGTLIATTLITGVESTSPSGSCTNGSIKISSSATTPGIYYCYGSTWHYSDQTSGFQIPNYESTDPITGEQMQVGDFVIPVVDKVYDDGTAHGVWSKWSTVKAQLLAELSVHGQGGQIGDGTVSTVDTNTITQQVTGVLKLLGISISEGVTNIAKLAVNSFTSDTADITTARINKIEMVASNGDIYCTWIGDDGEWQKVKGECGSSSVLVAQSSPSETTDQQDSQSSQDAIVAAQVAQDAAREAARAAQEAISAAQSAQASASEAAQDTSSVQDIESENTEEPTQIQQSEDQVTAEQPQQSEQTEQIEQQEQVEQNEQVQQDSQVQESPAETVSYSPGSLIQSATASLLDGAWQFIEWLMGLMRNFVLAVVPDNIEYSTASLTLGATGSIANGATDLSQQIQQAIVDMASVFKR